ncbi:MAG: flagellar biosynthesis protein FlhB [bacterium]|nr:flagellar biosynthesis protein FlhB [bacterium]
MSTHDPNLRAVGLRYDGDSEEAPRVVAKGRGEVAERILAIAKENGVAVRHDPDLMQMLSVVELGDEIPAEMYEAVARLVSFLYRMNEGLGTPPTA